MDYRSEDLHGESIGDQYEGRLKFCGSASHVTTEEVHDNPLLKTLIALKGGAQINITNFNARDCYANSPDLYIFSTSLDYSEDAHRRWRDDPDAGYDACFRIMSARLFFRAISQVLDPLASFMGFSKVTYYDSERGLDFRDPLAKCHPAQLKGGKNYEHQVEIRGFWKPRDQGLIKPIIEDFPAALKYCTRHAVIR